MFEKITPEQAGISSANVADYISVLERRGLATHSVLMMKGTDIFAEYYWAPFHRDFCHRMYSETKSYVAIAIGLLEEDGLVDLDKPIADYFADTPNISARKRVSASLTACLAEEWYRDPSYCSQASRV